MRKLTKVEQPPRLQANCQTLTAAYVAAGGRGSSPWRTKEILDALIAETFGKCAYCESKMSSVSFPHVEHIKPKSLFPELVVDWKNLTLACQVCNTNKLDYYDEIAPLLNPYEDDPLQHLTIVGPTIEGRPGSSTGRRTVDKLKLRRIELIIQRAEKIEALHRLIEKWHTSIGGDKQIMAEVILDELSDDREFVQTLRSYAATQGFPSIDGNMMPSSAGHS